MDSARTETENTIAPPGASVTESVAGCGALVVLAEARQTVSDDGIIFQNPKTGRCLPDAAFGEGGPAALIFEQSGGFPPPEARRSRRS